MDMNATFQVTRRTTLGEMTRFLNLGRKNNWFFFKDEPNGEALLTINKDAGLDSKELKSRDQKILREIEANALECYKHIRRTPSVGSVNFASPHEYRRAFEAARNSTESACRPVEFRIAV